MSPKGFVSRQGAVWKSCASLYNRKRLSRYLEGVRLIAGLAWQWVVETGTLTMVAMTEVQGQQSCIVQTTMQGGASAEAQCLLIHLLYTGSISFFLSYS